MYLILTANQNRALFGKVDSEEVAKTLLAYVDQHDPKPLLIGNFLSQCELLGALSAGYDFLTANLYHLPKSMLNCPKPTQGHFNTSQLFDVLMGVEDD